MLLCLFVLFWSRRCFIFFVILHNSLSAKTVGTLCDGLSRLNKLHFYLVLFSLEIKICLLFLFQSSFTLKSIRRRLQINHLRRRNPLKMTKSIVWGGKSCDNPTTTFWKNKNIYFKVLDLIYRTFCFTKVDEKTDTISFKALKYNWFKFKSFIWIDTEWKVKLKIHF